MTSKVESTPPQVGAQAGGGSQLIPPSVPKFKGIVKGVNSGDTITIQEVDGKNSGPPSEKQLTLSSLSAPHFGRAQSGDKEAIPDEPFAWESREFLRKKCIGKRVVFAIDNTHPASGREYATVYLVDSNNENVNNAVVAEGWATVHKPTGREVKRQDLLTLLQLEEQAIQLEKGQHVKNKKIALVKPTANIEPIKFFEKLKGKKLDAIVEQVRTGASYRVILPTTLQSFIVLLAGVQSPGWKRKEDGTQDPEPFAREAKFFAEQGVLHRDVSLVLNGVDKQGNIFATIEFAGIDVAENLLKQGLATYVPWSGALRGKESVNKLKAAEQLAKDGKRRLYANYVEKVEIAAPVGSLPKQFEGKVIGILNTLSLLVLPEGGFPEQQIALSSIRVPRPPFPNDEEEEKNMPAEKRPEFRAERAWAIEAKEMLRGRLIGQKVKVSLDYARKPGPRKEKEGEASTSAPINLPEKNFYTVHWGKVNVAVLLAEHGFAKVVEHKSGEDRAQDYDLLVLAENKARNASKGWHGPIDKAPSRRVNDLTIEGKNEKERGSQITRAKQFLPFLQRTKMQKAIVDHVFSGGRFKLFIQKESCAIFYSLGGIKVVKRGEGNAENDEISNMALQFAREKLNQREVTVEVDGIDKGGNFVGQLSMGGRSNNFAVDLVREGFAFVHHPSAERMYNYRDLQHAEEEAKAERRNIWKNYNPEEEKRAQQEASTETDENNNNTTTSQSGAEYFDVYVTEIVDGAHFFVQLVNENTSSLDSLVQTLTELSMNETSGVPFTPRAGDLVRAQFTEDDSWYRARITSSDAKNDRYDVLYVDYGNSETIPSSRIRVLPAAYQSLPSQAKEAGLAYVKAPKLESDWGREAQATLRDLTHGKKLMASVEYKEDNRLLLSLADAESSVHINATMIRTGLARVLRERPRDARRRRILSNPVVAKLREEEEKARSAHVGVWQYGDAPDSDEDEDEPRVPRAKPAATAKGAPAEKPASGKK